MQQVFRSLLAANISWDKWTDFSLPEIDPALFYSYRIGVAVGVVVLTTLVIFPGTSHSVSTLPVEQAKKFQRPTENEHQQHDGWEKLNENTVSDKRKHVNREIDEPPAVAAIQRGIATVSKSFDRENKRMPPQIPKSRRAAEGWTPHQKMNLLVYVILITITVVILTREYGSDWTIYVKHFFPREAAVFDRILRP